MRVEASEKLLHRFQSNVCSHPDDVFFREGLAFFSKTILNHILHNYISMAS